MLAKRFGNDGKATLPINSQQRNAVQAFLKEVDEVQKAGSQYLPVSEFLQQLEVNRASWNESLKQTKRQAKLDIIAKVNDVLSAYPENSVCLYGTGSHTAHLLSNIERIEVIRSVLTGNDEEVGKHLAGKVSEQLSAPYPKAIIISSDTYEESIYRRISHLKNEGSRTSKIVV